MEGRTEGRRDGGSESWKDTDRSPLDSRHWGVYNSTQIWYSDDGGKTYVLAGPSGVFPEMDECTLAQSPVDGDTVILNMRNNHLEGNACRAVAISRDGGETWSKAELDCELPTPVCQASLASFQVPAGAMVEEEEDEDEDEEKEEDDNHHGDINNDGAKFTPALLFSNPASPTARINGAVKKSLDGGSSWQRNVLEITVAGASVVNGGSFDYSAIVQRPLPDDETGTTGGILWGHNVGGKACGSNPFDPALPRGCWVVFFSRFPLGF